MRGAVARAQRCESIEQVFAVAVEEIHKVGCGVLQCDTVCCRVLQGVAVCCCVCIEMRVD